MKKILLSLFIILSFSLYILHERFGVGESEKPNVIAPQTLLPSPSTQDTTSSQISTSPTPNTKFKDGEYTGPVADAYYGPLQVKVSISGGKISDVTFLQYPNDRSNSIAINTQAMPYLKQEAIQAQSANVDIVSGATQTSLAFRQTLGSALSQAQ